MVDQKKLVFNKDIGEKIGGAINFLVVAYHHVSDEELEAALSDLSKRHTLEPLTDPTAYRNDMHGYNQMETVLRAFQEFRSAVKGIGYFKQGLEVILPAPKPGTLCKSCAEYEECDMRDASTACGGYKEK